MSGRHAPAAAGEPRPTVAPDLEAAGRALFPGATAMEAIAGREHLIRVETAGGAWRVRRWPEAATEARIAFVHGVLERARAEGLSLAPEVAGVASAGEGGVLALGGRRYDAQGWVAGRAAGSSLPGREAEGGSVELPAALSEAAFLALAEAVARLHGATEELAGRREVPTAALTGVVAAVRGAWAAQRARLRPVAARTPLVQRWLAAGERALPAALAALERLETAEPGRRAVLHLGLWPSHVILDRPEGTRGPGEAAVVGVIGWEGAAAGPPVLDLAQLVTRCRGWSAADAELALAAYAGVRPLAPEERRLLPAVAALDLVATAGSLLDRAFAARRDADDAPPPSALRAGAEAAVAALETAAAVAAQGDEPRKSGARRWQRRPRPPGGGAGGGQGRGAPRGSKGPPRQGGPRRRGPDRSGAPRRGDGGDRD